MEHVLIALGSSISSEHSVRETVRRLSLRCQLLAVSPVYETVTVRTTHQASFLNAAALIETDLAAGELKTQVLQLIEQELGRVRTKDTSGPRTIDLDMALCSDQVLDVGPRHIPDPEMFKYPHIAAPLADLAPR